MTADSEFFLLEKLGGVIADICLTFTPVQSVEVTLRKPAAIPQADYAGISIERSRK
jgi:dihydroneopterin aldolase